MSQHPIRLVWITPDAEALVAYIARVSNPDNQDNPAYEKLIRYLLKHRHWSPFEMASACFEIKTTRAIAPQILRHRSFSFQEFSQRYAVAPLEDFTMPDLRYQDQKNRQSSLPDADGALKARFAARTAELFAHARGLYDDMIAAGVAKETARAVLPLNTPTTLYMTGTLRSWIHYIDLRSANGTQLEHQQIAVGIRDILAQHLPAIARALEWAAEEGVQSSSARTA